MTHNNLTCLLDFDSTRGVLEDKTGKNVLTNNSNNVVIKKLGRVYSAYFNTVPGGADYLQTLNIEINSTSFVVSTWIRCNYYGGNQTVWSLGNDISSPNFIYVMLDTGSIVYYSALDNNSAALVNTTYTSTNQYRQRFLHILTTWNFNAKTTSLYTNGVNRGNISYSGSISPSNKFTLGNRSITTYYRNLRGYMPKLQVFKGLPNNMDQFVSQIYNSQKWQFGI